MKHPAALFSTVLIVALSLGIGAHVTSAHKGATGVVKKRMTAMSDMGKGMKNIGLMLTGRKTYDAAQVKDAAKMISAHAADIPKLFPKGSGHKPSVAKPKVWKNWKEFEAMAQRLEGYAQALEAGADNKMTMDGMKMTPQMMSDPAHLKMMPPKIIFAQVAKSCSACHDSYREEKDK